MEGSESPDDVESMLRSESLRLGPQGLRRFALECCRRISTLCPDPVYEKMLDSAESLAKGVDPPHDSSEVESEYGQLYDALYPGFGTPSAKVLALVAVGEACRQSALDAAMSASSTAAMAMADGAAAAHQDAQGYDEAHEVAFREERAFQLELLKKLSSNDAQE